MPLTSSTVSLRCRRPTLAREYSSEIGGKPLLVSALRHPLPLRASKHLNTPSARFLQSVPEKTA